MSDQPTPTFEDYVLHCHNLQHYKNRFAVLAGDRFRLHAPDLLELRWTVFDNKEHRTIAWGDSPERATDGAFEHCARKGIQLLTRNYVYPHPDL